MAHPRPWYSAFHLSRSTSVDCSVGTNSYARGAGGSVDGACDALLGANSVSYSQTLLGRNVRIGETIRVFTLPHVLFFCRPNRKDSFDGHHFRLRDCFLELQALLLLGCLQIATRKVLEQHP